LSRKQLQEPRIHEQLIQANLCFLKNPYQFAFVQIVGYGLPFRDCCAIAISGLLDLAPLTKTAFFQNDLRLYATQMRQLSPANLPLLNAVRLILAVGALETRDFHHQSSLLAAHRPLRMLFNPPDF
jgi:hypothetical protein